MNLEQLRGFVAITKTGNFTRAADQLHLAQPSLSRQIASLEQNLGIELFNRVRGNVTLTAAGERLLPIARRMLADAETAHHEMAELAGLRSGRIRLGATPTLCTSLVVEVLTEFQASYPGIDLEIVESGSRSLISALIEGSLDLALIVTSLSSGADRAVLELEPLLLERLVVVSGGAFPTPFESEQRVTLRELATVPQLMFPDNYDLRGAIDTAMLAADLTPSVALTGAEMDAALRFTERGLGVAVVPAMITVDRPSLRVTPLVEPDLTRTVSLARRTDMAPTHAGAALQALIHDVAARFTAPGAATEHLVQTA